MEALNEVNGLVDLDSDEALEAALHGELVDIARCNGVTHPDTLRDILLAVMSEQ